MKSNIVLTCEHATNFIPEKYRDIFDPKKHIKGKWAEGKLGDIIKDHFGYDIGALELASFISKEIRTPLRSFPVCRLLIEGNRYRKKSFFSKLTKNLPEKEKRFLIETYWIPHINLIERDLQKTIKNKGCVLHLGFHSFTPKLKGQKERNCDIGVLFDPKYSEEKKLAHKFQNKLKEQLPDFVVRRNYPYPGYSEGLTRYFHKKFPPNQYMGIELEINNKHLLKENKDLYKKILKAIENLEKI